MDSTRKLRLRAARMLPYWEDAIRTDPPWRAKRAREKGWMPDVERYRYHRDGCILILRASDAFLAMNKVAAGITLGDAERDIVLGSTLAYCPTTPAPDPPGKPPAPA